MDNAYLRFRFGTDDGLTTCQGERRDGSEESGGSGVLRQPRWDGLVDMSRRLLARAEHVGLQNLNCIHSKRFGDCNHRRNRVRQWLIWGSRTCLRWADARFGL